MRYLSNFKSDIMSPQFYKCYAFSPFVWRKNHLKLPNKCEKRHRIILLYSMNIYKAY